MAPGGGGRVARLLAGTWLLAGAAAALVSAVAAWRAGRPLPWTPMGVETLAWLGLAGVTPAVVGSLGRFEAGTKGPGTATLPIRAGAALAFTASWALAMAVAIKVLVPTRAEMSWADLLLKTWMAGLPATGLAFVATVLAVRLSSAATTEVPASTPVRVGRDAGRADPYVLAIPVAGGVERVPITGVLWIEARGYHAVVHLADRTYLLREPLGTLADRHATAGLVQTHRSAVVNVRHALRFESRTEGEARVVLTDGTSVPVSRRRRAAVGRALGRR